MKVDQITIETIRYPNGDVRNNAVILWTEDGVPHTLPDVDHNIAYATQLAEKEDFEVLTATVAALHQTT